MTRGVDGGIDSGDSASERDAHWQRVAQRLYEPERDDELTTAIVFTLADAADVQPTELTSPPLYEVVDAAAIEEVFFGSGRAKPGVGTVEFRYGEYRVEVRSDGWVHVFESTETEGS